VNASACERGGLESNGAANVCGMELARPYVNEWQNRFDAEILQVANSTGVPAQLMKNIFSRESQFWPGRWGEYHFGLGHLTYFGAHTTLYWRPTLYKEICSVAGQCGDEIGSQEINYYLNLMDAYCPTCENKIDLPKAQRSITYLAEALYAHCEQTARIVYNASKMTPGAVVDYATIWKLTLMDYNVGPTCVFDSVSAAYKFTKSGVTWWDVSYFTGDSQCQRGIYYANQITEKFYDFPPK